MPRKKAVVAVEQLEAIIHEMRGRRVIFDADLANLYGVETRVLIQAVQRNEERFPEDFAFRLTKQEVDALKSQSVILKPGGQKPGGRRRGLPWAFTEHGAVMVANVLRSPAAIDMSIHVVRVFVRIRQTLAVHAEFARELQKLKRGLAARFSEYDEQFRVVFRAIEQLITPPEAKRGKIGFHRKDD